MNNLISVKISDLELFKQRIIGLNNTNYRKNLRTYYQNYTTTKPINDFIEEVNKRVNQYLINRNIFSGRAYKEIKLNLNEVEQEINLKELLRIKTKLESALFTLTNNLQVGKPIRSTTIRAIHRHYNEIINMIVGYNNKSKKTLLSGFLSEIVKNSKKGNYK